MRLTCPLCGERDRREFYYYGAEDYLRRPEESAPLSEWDNYLHLRDNPAGMTKDLWYHEAGCSQWLLVTRNTVTHAISAVELVSNRGSRPGPEPVRILAARAKAKPEPKAEAKAATKRAPKAAKVEAKTDERTGKK